MERSTFRLVAIGGGGQVEEVRRFNPGPAHLDTCEFYVQPNTKSSLVLKYVGLLSGTTDRELVYLDVYFK
ncbi:hypothetical protein EON64_05700 [archaeon]|nr:MAG: hypothetical protein EON64_05700 [archaeon]